MVAVSDEKTAPGAIAVDIKDSPTTTTVMKGVTCIQGGSTWSVVLKDVVRSALGLVAAEVWLDEPASSAMRRPNGGYYGDPVYDISALEFLAADAGVASPGVGLAGILQGSSEFTNLKQLANDEDTPNDPRLVAASKLFGFATAAEFDGGLLVVFSRSDAVLPQLKQPAQASFLGAMARVCAALAAATPARDAIVRKKGGASGWRKLRGLLRTGLLGQAMRLQREREARGEAADAGAAAGPKARAAGCPRAVAWATWYLGKFKGAKGASAPALNWRKRAAWETPAWTWVGIAATLLTLSGLNELTVQESDGDYFLMLGSFGALMALQFGAPKSAAPSSRALDHTRRFQAPRYLLRRGSPLLTPPPPSPPPGNSSPLAQPRNAVFGCSLAAGIAVLFYYLSGDGFLGVIPKWVAVALAPATAIAVSQRCGVLHPPAGAASLIFVGGGAKITDLGWMYLLMPLLVGNLVCCMMAMLINNLSRKRQYPVFW